MDLTENQRTRHGRDLSITRKPCPKNTYPALFKKKASCIKEDVYLAIETINLLGDCIWR